MSRQTQYIRAKNSTGRKIEKGTITHATEDYGLQTIRLDGLAADATSDTIEVYTGPSSRDYWYVSWSIDGRDFVAYSNRNAIHGHESRETPGTVELFGVLGKGDLKVCFFTDDDSKDCHDILNPWD